MSDGPNFADYRLVESVWEPDLGSWGPKSSRRPVRYSAYVPGPVAERTWSLPSNLAAAITRTEQACARLELDSERIGLDTVARQLLRADSVASSRIEGLVVSNRRLAKAAWSPEGDITARSVLANVAAVEHAYSIAARNEPFVVDSITAVHRSLFGGTPEEQMGGVIRSRQNWIGGGANSPERAEFIPCPASELPALMEDLVAFCNRVDLPPVLQAAIAHAQFETLHPFADGNGRTGRALIGMILIRRGICGRAVVPVSLVLAANADAYISGLTAWRYSDPLEWFSFFVRAVEEAAAALGELAARIADLQGRWLEAAGSPRAGSAAKTLIMALPSCPILDLATAREVAGLSDEACRRAINRLSDAGVLKEASGGRRYRTWEAVGLFALLDRIERSVGDPSRAPRSTR